ncbi:MAG TPA: tRNA (uridine(54)-C5)-methyltransferase TrmA [Arsenophonus nasoniae]|uniref:tRNA (uridine(54)-C5)-methyltransferase TrmA n=1 Tax=Arsenophonus nasoniae TaxID=638 RepID=UPI003879F73E
MLNNLSITQYNSQLTEKIKYLNSIMLPYNAPKPEIFRSDFSYYRMRAEFRLWHEGQDLFHIMFDQTTKQRIRIDQLPIACKLINQMMVALIPLIKSKSVLRYKLFQVDYLSTLSNKIIVSLIYHKKLNEEWIEQAKQLRMALINQGFDIQLIGRAAKTKIILEQDHIDEVLPIAGKSIIYRQIENSFTQPNAGINIKMLEWAIDCTKNAKGDLLELYCGNGNFSIALAQNFNRILATEIAKPSVAAAQYNIEANKINNVKIIRMSAEDFTQAIQGERQFRRLECVDLMSYKCNTILIDPPRCGLDEKTVALVQKYPRILYISCNPNTLCHNLNILNKTHKIHRLALFDQFPYTHHIECGVLLENKDI